MTVTAMLQNAGSGARMVVFGERSNGVGHVFNGINQGGTVRFLDGQTGSAAFLILKQDFEAKYPSLDAVPESERPRLDYLLRVNQTMFDKAENLGWQPFNP